MFEARVSHWFQHVPGQVDFVLNFTVSENAVFLCMFFVAGNRGNRESPCKKGNSPRHPLVHLFYPGTRVNTSGSCHS